MLGYVKYCNSETLSDVTVKYGQGGEQTFHGHRVVFCSKSYYFEKAFTGSFQESTSNVIALQGDKPDRLQDMLKFMYDGGLPEEGKDCTKNVHLNLDLFEVADKYDVPDMYIQAAARFEKTFAEYVDMVASSTANPAKDEDFSDIIGKVYGLAGAAAPMEHTLVRSVLDALMAHKDFMPLSKKGRLQSTFALCIINHAELGRDVLLWAITETPHCAEPVLVLTMKVKCPTCKQQWNCPVNNHSTDISACALCGTWQTNTNWFAQAAKS